MYIKLGIFAAYQSSAHHHKTVNILVVKFTNSFWKPGIHMRNKYIAIGDFRQKG